MISLPESLRAFKEIVLKNGFLDVTNSDPYILDKYEQRIQEIEKLRREVEESKDFSE